MKILKKTTREVTTNELQHTICDKCGEKVAEFGEWGNTFNFKFKIKEGSFYPEGGMGEKTEMDLCYECASGLVTLLNTLGYETRKEDTYH